MSRYSLHTCKEAWAPKIIHLTLFIEDTASSFFTDSWTKPKLNTAPSVTLTNTPTTKTLLGKVLKTSKGINFCAVESKNIIANEVEDITEINHPWKGAIPSLRVIAKTITTAIIFHCIKALTKQEKINHSDATLWTKKYFNLFSKAILLPSAISKGIKTIILSSSLTHNASQFGLEADMTNLKNNTAFRSLPDEK